MYTKENKKNQVFMLESGFQGHGAAKEFFEKNKLFYAYINNNRLILEDLNENSILTTSEITDLQISNKDHYIRIVTASGSIYQLWKQYVTTT